MWLGIIKTVSFDDSHFEVKKVSIFQDKMASKLLLILSLMMFQFEVFLAKPSEPMKLSKASGEQKIKFKISNHGEVSLVKQSEFERLSKASEERKMKFFKDLFDRADTDKDGIVTLEEAYIVAVAGDVEKINLPFIRLVNDIVQNALYQQEFDLYTTKYGLNFQDYKEILNQKLEEVYY